MTASKPDPYREFLRKIDLFADLPEEDLVSICDMTSEITLAAGELLFAEGSQGDQAFIIKSGELEIFKTVNQRPVLLSVRGSGSVIGETALLIETPRNASVSARQETVLLVIQKEQFNQLLARSPSASRVLLNTVLARWQSNMATLNQSQKMAQLGTLTAGVAHELNNPAAAVQRSAGQLQEALETYSAATSELFRLDITDSQRAFLDALRKKASQAPATPDFLLDPLARSDWEGRLETWLDQHEVAEAWELAPALVNMGLDLPGLAEIASRFERHQIPLIVRWLNLTYTLHSLAHELNQGAGRISAIVKALKSYSYLDQAPVQDVDIHAGLENTLLILRNKVKNIRVQREYDPLLPRILAYGSELNQVWTNLIDNACDALENTPDPEIVLRTTSLGSWIRVDVEDNGPGIPHEIQGRIFDTFFTTKPPGKGTGLGLDITYKIVTDQQRGDIKFFSRPGSTSFRVLLPVNFETSNEIEEALNCSPQKIDQIAQRLLETTQTVWVVGTDESASGDRAACLPDTWETQPGPDRLPFPPDLVIIFTEGKAAEKALEQAIQLGARAVWLESGDLNTDRAWLAGMDVVERRLVDEERRKQAAFYQNGRAYH
jgi:signal transduction histidine kinase